MTLNLILFCWFRPEMPGRNRFIPFLFVLLWDGAEDKHAYLSSVYNKCDKFLLTISKERFYCRVTTARATSPRSACGRSPSASARWTDVSSASPSASTRPPPPSPPPNSPPSATTARTTSSRDPLGKDLGH